MYQDREGSSARYLAEHHSRHHIKERTTVGSGHGGLCVDMRWLGGGYAEIPVVLYEVPSLEETERIERGDWLLTLRFVW